MNPGVRLSQNFRLTNSTLVPRRSKHSSVKRCLHVQMSAGGRKNATNSGRFLQGQCPPAFPQEDINIPGVDKVFAKDYSAFGKLFWVTAITACFISCSVLTIKRIVRYSETPTAIRVEVIRRENLTFPAITICPFYPFLFSENIDKLRDQYADQFKVNYTKLGYFMDNTKIRHLELLKLPNISAAELWDNARVGIYEHNTTCQFESRRNCNQKVLFRDVYTHFGICITAMFDSNIIYDGSYNGVEIRLMSHTNTDAAYWQHTVLLHDADDEPTHILYKEGGQPIHPKRETTVTFLTKQFKRVNIKRRPCLPKKEVTRCISNCIKKHIIQVASCKLPFINDSTLPECLTPETATKTYDATMQVYKNIQGLCKNCPEKCVEFYYSPLYDAVYYRKFTSPKVLLVDNIIELVQEDESYYFDSLLADIGGNLGLFLGVCTLTLFQLLEAMVMKCVFMTKRSITPKHSTVRFTKPNRDSRTKLVFY